MKRSLLALAVLGAFAGAASAQSSVTLFGIVDLSVGNISNKTGAGTKTTTQQMLNSGLNTSRLGFRGVEDLGGGLKAGFWIEGEMAADNGTAGGQNWRRRSTVSLMGNFGEVRLGRDYTPTYWNLAVFDPFGINGVGAIFNVLAPTNPLGSGALTLSRADNGVAYFLPTGIGGLYGSAMVTAGEGVDGNKYGGGRIGYAANNFDIAAAYGETGRTNKYKLFNIGGSVKLGSITKIMALFNQGKYLDRKQTTYLLGAAVTLGQGEVHATWTRADMNGNSNTVGYRDQDDADQIALGYVYNLSKRTALYGTASRIKNDNASNFIVGGMGSAVGGTSVGVQAGLRHSF